MKAILIMSTLVISKLTLLLLTGCSVFGYALGEAIDDTSEPLFVQQDLQMNKLSFGQPIQFVTFRGDTVTGEFLWVRWLGLAEYSRFYSDDLRDTESTAWLPAIGQNIIVNLHQDRVKRQVECDFLAFDIDRLWVSNFPAKGDTDFVMFEHLVWVKDKHDEMRSLSSRQIHTLVSNKGVPSLSAIVIRRSKKGEEVIPFNQVSIIARTKGYARWVGLAAGFVIDVMIVRDYLMHGLFENSNLLGDFPRTK